MYIYQHFINMFIIATRCLYNSIMKLYISHRLFAFILTIFDIWNGYTALCYVGRQNDLEQYVFFKKNIYYNSTKPFTEEKYTNRNWVKIQANDSSVPPTFLFRGGIISKVLFCSAAVILECKENIMKLKINR